VPAARHDAVRHVYQERGQAVEIIADQAAIHENLGTQPHSLKAQPERLRLPLQWHYERSPVPGHSAIARARGVPGARDAHGLLALLERVPASARHRRRRILQWGTRIRGGLLFPVRGGIEPGVPPAAQVQFGAHRCPVHIGGESSTALARDSTAWRMPRLLPVACRDGPSGLIWQRPCIPHLRRRASSRDDPTV